MPRYLNLTLRSPEPDLCHEMCLGARKVAEAEGITERVMTPFEVYVKKHGNREFNE
jgi:hypothetical protein